MNRPPTTSTPSKGLAFATCAAGIGALALHLFSPGPSDSSRNVPVRQEDSAASAAGHRQEGVNRVDADSKAQSVDVRARAL
ncbi:hypothetical protein K466DRAFT_129971 [Polyporus arcularius HHB13444]|uniref:Uncharacterized protein n=1 Tax=Polyporus arcularius HHB13444 TaxID=1314778 RepID=A0A5C3PZR7_9APHY|nr:hypothetical protein K466DRAFT_129971 [Polyporus arcularius HHB13444]